MNGLYRVGGKMRRAMGFALMVAFLSLGVISGCGSSNDDNDLFGSLGSGGSDGSDGSDGGLGAVDRWLWWGEDRGLIAAKASIRLCSMCS